VEKVLYEELFPEEFSARLNLCPVAYLPLGTLEWHGPHLPLGADGIQAEGLFTRLASEVGGIVLPMLFVGPDFRHKIDPETKEEFYGMDVGSIHRPGVMCSYPDQQLIGSAYYISENLFGQLLETISFQLKRAGFKIIVAHGHGPSSQVFSRMAGEIEKTVGIRCVDCITSVEEEKLPYQIDHAGANETSIVMALRPDLVKMENLPSDPNEKPLAIIGSDPRAFASPESGEKSLRITTKEVKRKIFLALGYSHE